jgi:RNA polymerase sigma-70 factor (ECF subfamily)
VGTSPIGTLNQDLQTLFGVGTVGGLSDGQLLGCFAARRDEAAFEALIQRHGPMVWGVCRRILRDHHDAEEAFQATFLVLARKAPSIAHRELVANWLYAVAYKTAVRARAMASKRQARERQVTEMPEPESASEAMRDDLLSRLDQELSRLPEKYRVPIVLCELEGKTHKEAAEHLGWPIGTVSGRLSRAKAMLARRLARPGLSLTVGSLAVLLARESASASIPTKLIGHMTQAAGLSAAGQAVTAGMDSAGVAALTEGVLKAMLLSKLKNVVAFLVVALIGTGVIGVGVIRMTSWVTAAGSEPVLTAAAGANSAVQNGQPKSNESKGEKPYDKEAKSKEAFKRWTYPNATPSDVIHSHPTINGETDGRCSTGHYSTVDPFHEVVRFYVERSGFEPPNWSILGRKFPGDTINIPATWTKCSTAKSLTLDHHIRPDSAIFGILKTDFDGGETISVSISCGTKDKRTFIQVTRHAQN